MTAACSALMTARRTQRIKAFCLLLTQLMCGETARYAG